LPFVGGAFDVAIVVPLAESRSRQIENQPHVGVHDFELRGRYVSFGSTPWSGSNEAADWVRAARDLLRLMSGEVAV